MVTAKPVVKNKFWILRENDRKVGTVEKNKNEFVVNMYNQQSDFKSIKTLKNRTNIEFEEEQDKKWAPEFQVNGFPTNAKPYNAVYNVQKRLPIFTKKNKSKSWHAAGYYQIIINGKTVTKFCPKLILLQRYPYVGPAKSIDGFTYK
jgi:hypothetical protein